MVEVIKDFFSALWQDITAYFSTPLGFGGPLIKGQIVIWAIVIGFAICAAVSLFNKIFLGRLVNFLIKEKAESPETAVSPDGKVKFNFIRERALRSKGVFSKIVRTEDTDVPEFSKRRYYILPADYFRAQNLYSKNGANAMSFIITLILLIAFAAVAYKILPKLLEMAGEVGEAFTSTKS